MQSLVSVIVPVYNTEKYLQKCIDSIVNQSYRNIEVILIDDGSTDNSASICDKFAENDNRVIVFHKDNEGLSVARNFGIDRATGEYILFVDSDDYIDAMMIEKLHNKIVLDNADISICSFNYIDENGKILDLKAEDKVVLDRLFTSKEAYDGLCSDNKTSYIVSWNKLYKKKLFDTIRFPRWKQHEDLMVAHLIYEKCDRITTVNEPLYYYLQRDSSIMGQKFNIKFLDMAEAYYICAKFFIDKSLWYHAVFSFKYMRRIMAIGRLRLDFKNTLVDKRYRELKNYYNSIFLKVLLHTKTFKTFKYTLLFYFSPKLYQKYWEQEKRDGF